MPRTSRRATSPSSAPLRRSASSSGPPSAAVDRPLTCALRETALHGEGFSVAVCVHAANHVILPHEHPLVHICLPLDGCWCEHCAQQSHVLEPGWSFTLAAGATHGSYTGESGSRCLHLTLAPEHPAAARLLRLVARDGSHRHAAPGPTLLRPLVAEVLAADAWTVDTVPLLFEETLEAIAQARGRRPPRRGALRRSRVTQALRHIATAHRTPLTLEAVAADAGMTGPELVRAFRGLFGTTPGDILRRHRAATARAELARPGITRSAAAHRAGFADLSHMTRVLRQLAP